MDINSIILIAVISVAVLFFGWKIYKDQKNKPKKAKIIKGREKTLAVTSLVATLREVQDVKRILPELTITPKPPEIPKPIPGKYPAMVFTKEGIKFKRLPEKVGNVFYLEPSMPRHGAHFVVMERQEDKYTAYDPREAPILSKETPQSCYDATNFYKDVNAFWQEKQGIWDKVNTILIGLIIAGAFLVAIVAIDKVGK